MNAPRIISMTALGISLVFILFAMTQVNSSVPGPSDISATAQFCLELEHFDTDCSIGTATGAVAR